jgi:hypothetical protein
MTNIVNIEKRDVECYEVRVEFRLNLKMFPELRVLLDVLSVFFCKLFQVLSESVHLFGHLLKVRFGQGVPLILEPLGGQFVFVDCSNSGSSSSHLQWSL